MNSDADWEKTRRLLREHLAAPPPLAHPEFLNHRVLEAIEREDRAPRRPLFSLPRLAWAGAMLLVAAGAITAVLQPGRGDSRSAEEFISQVVAARSSSPRLSVTAFRPETGDRGVVLWIEGADFIPASEPVR